MNRRSAGLFALVIASAALPARAAPPVDVPAPVCSDGSRGGASIAFDDAFAHPIDDARTLRFLTRLATMDLRRQRDVIANVRRLGPDDSLVPADAEAGCRTESSYRTIRGLTLLTALWKLDRRDATFDLLARRVEIALAKLDSDAALAPFGLRPRNLEGLVRSVTPLKSTAGNRPGAQALLDESIFAAAATTYEPQFTSCVPIAG